MTTTAAIELLKPFGPPSGVVVIGGKPYLFEQHENCIVFVHDGKRRTVRLVGGRPCDCDCEQRVYRGLTCKHMTAAEAILEGGRI